MKVVASLLSALFATTAVSAHATFQQFGAAGTDFAGQCVRAPINNNPVNSVTGSSLACNANPGKAKGLCTVAAGSKASVEMHQQPGDRSCSNEAIGGNHDGPVIVYMAKVNDALTADGASAKWFKVAETGLVSKEYWGTDVMNKNCGKYEFTIPACIQPGDYLLRAEVIALHVAGSSGGAQLYISCFTLRVTGGGGASPATVSLPGAYRANDPGILFNLYGSYTSYTVPGPQVFQCSGNEGPAPPYTAPPATVAPPVATTAPEGPAAPLYGQCGGINWQGATHCAQGTCKPINDHYHQCTP